MKREKILFLLHLPPPVHGASNVGATIKDSYVVNDSYSCRFINLGTSINIYEIGTFKVLKIFRLFSVFVNTIFSLIFFRPALCYFTIGTSGFAFYKDTLLICLLKVFRVPIVYHFHNKGVERSKLPKVKRILNRFVYNNTYAIVLSKRLIHDIEGYFHSDSVFCCANGIPKQNKREQLDAAQHPNVCQILFLSNLIESKGVLVLLEACKLLANERIPFACNFVGGEGDVSFTELKDRIHKLDLNDCINILGPRYGAEKGQIMMDSNLFVFPTFYYNECFPLVILEAMQAGLPVISTKEGAIPDIIIDGKTGFLVEQRNARCLADKIKELIKDERLRRDMGIAAKSRFEKNFTLEIFEKRLCEIFDNILDKV